MQYIKNDATACSLFEYLVIQSKYVCLHFFLNTKPCQNQSNNKFMF